MRDVHGRCPAKLSHSIEISGKKARKRLIDFLAHSTQPSVLERFNDWN